MRILIDECVDERLRFSFPGHGCQTARFAGVAGLKNGQLIEAAEAAGFEVLITIDQSMPDQQNLAGRRIALVILCAPTSRLRDLESLVPAAAVALETIAAGEVVRIKDSRLDSGAPGRSPAT